MSPLDRVFGLIQNFFLRILTWIRVGLWIFGTLAAWFLAHFSTFDYRTFLRMLWSALLILIKESWLWYHFSGRGSRFDTGWALRVTAVGAWFKTWCSCIKTTFRIIETGGSILFFVSLCINCRHNTKRIENNSAKLI